MAALFVRQFEVLIWIILYPFIGSDTKYSKFKAGGWLVLDRVMEKTIGEKYGLNNNQI